MTRTVDTTPAKSPVESLAEGSILARIRRSKVAPTTISLIAKLVTLVVVSLFDYVLVTVAAVQGVPMIMAFVQSGTGMTMDMSLEVVLGVWLLPALFFIGMLFALVLAIIRGVWRLRKRILTKLKAALTASETVTV